MKCTLVQSLLSPRQNANLAYRTSADIALHNCRTAAESAKLGGAYREIHDPLRYLSTQVVPEKQRSVFEIT